MSILVGIDGTSADLSPGRSRDKRYDFTFVNSFVRRICTGFPSNKRYLRGPVALGGGLMNAILEGQNFILSSLRASVHDPILLAGYSRGAAGVIEIAARLQRQRIDVKAMLLFDCVDRHVGIDATFIPTNVRHVLHVMRAPEAGSRKSFGNAGTNHAASTEYNEAEFHCTHAGMSGVPWPVPADKSRDAYVDEGFPDGITTTTYAQDAWGSTRVWSYVGPFISKHGFK